MRCSDSKHPFLSSTRPYRNIILILTRIKLAKIRVNLKNCINNLNFLNIKGQFTSYLGIASESFDEFVLKFFLSKQFILFIIKFKIL